MILLLTFSTFLSSFLADPTEPGRDVDSGVDMGDFPNLGNFHSYVFRFFNAIFDKILLYFILKIFCFM